MRRSRSAVVAAAPPPPPVPNLPEVTLDRGLHAIGSPRAIHPLFSQLHAGEPIVIGVLGASVGQNAGCLDQGRKRCMMFSGREGPRFKPFKGFAVRLLDHINRSYPHANHQINNSALDATPLQTVETCLLSHLPPRLHLVIIDFGSMAQHQEMASLEGVVRILTSLTPAPLVLMVSIHEWCTQRISPRKPYAMGDFLAGSLAHHGYVYPSTPWSMAENECSRVCEHYGQACVSVHSALWPHVAAKDDGFGLTDVVGPDCMHPRGGRYGVPYITQLLTHWFDTAHDLWLRVNSSRPKLLRSGRQQVHMPRPIHARNQDGFSTSARCMQFTRAGGRVPPRNAKARPVVWCSGGSLELSKGAIRTREECWSTAGQCPKELGNQPTKNPDAAVAILRDLLAKPPDTWFWCDVSLNHARKPSQGVVALRPGAVMMARADALVGDVEPNSTGLGVTILIEHMVSYEGMGVAAVRCGSGCVCEEQRIDAHRAGEVRDVSVFRRHSFAAHALASGAPCELRFEVLAATSSGGHKFKVRGLTIRPTAPPSQRARGSGDRTGEGD